MSVTIRKTFEVAGVPTDVTSIVLANAGDTIGVKRNDTGAVVVATGTAMTKVSGTTGVYEYTLTEPAADLTYTAYFRIVYAGVTYQLEDVFQAAGDVEVAMPDLTGDNLVDTLNSLIVERLRVARGGPKPSYSIHGHKVDWTQYLDYLDKRIAALRREVAMTDPLEEIGIGL